MKSHNLVDNPPRREIKLDHRPVLDHSGNAIAGLHAVQITLDNPSEYNSYTSDMVKEIILALREASNDRAAVAVVLTGSGTNAFCTGGNTREYAEIFEYYSKPGVNLTGTVSGECCIRRQTVVFYGKRTDPSEGRTHP